MSWRDDLRAQVVADQREAARLRGAPATDGEAPPTRARHFSPSTVLCLGGPRRRIVERRGEHAE